MRPTVHGVVFQILRMAHADAHDDRGGTAAARAVLQQRQQHEADHQHHEASRRRGGKGPLNVIHDATPLPACHVSPMAAPNEVESCRRVCPQLCERMSKLGRVRGQSAARPSGAETSPPVRLP